MTTLDDRPLTLAAPETAGPSGTPRSARLGRWRCQPAWIVVVACLAVLVRNVTDTGLSNDTYWQWATGAWMLRHHTVVHSDVFSFTIAGHHWLDAEWGFQLTLAWLVRTIGPVGFWVVSAGASSAALLVSVVRWRALGTRSLAMGGLSVVGAAYLLIGDVARPQTFSYLFFALELLILTGARARARRLAWLPLLFFCWANSHGSFLAGLAVLGLEAILTSGAVRARVERGRVAVCRPLGARDAALALAASTAACCANPNGPALFGYVVRVSTNHELASLIEEWQSPNFHSWFLLGLVAIPIAVAAFLVVVRERDVRAFDGALSAATLLAALHAQRFLPYFGLSVTGLIAGMTAPRASRLKPSLASAPIALALAVGLIAIGPHRAPGSPDRTGSAAVPVAAVNWLRGRGGRVFSTYAWNDYLIHAGLPVFVDGRTDLYFGTGILRQWVAVDTLATNPDTVLSRWNVTYVLWPPRSALSTYLAHDPRWRLVWHSRQSSVFGRRTEPTGHPALTRAVR